MTPQQPFKVPPVPHFDGPADLLVKLGHWVWIKLLAPLWVDPTGWPLYCWILPYLTVCLLLFFAWRRWAGVSFAYRSPRFFNVVHGRLWAPLLLLGLWGTLFFGSPLLAVKGGPSWRPDGWLCLRPHHAYITFAVGFLLSPLPLSFLLIRLIRSTVHVGIHGAAAWAARNEVRSSPSWPWLIPLKVHFRGIRRPWVDGGGMVALAPSREVTRRHILLRGGTGSGKGFFIFGHILATASQAMIYQDVKAECPALDHLHTVTGMDPIRWGAATSGGWPSVRWNPLEECRHDPDPMDAFEALAAVLIAGDDKDWVPQLARPILAWVLASNRHETLAALADDFTARGVETVLKDAELPEGLLQSLAGKNVKEYIGTTIFANLAPFRSGWGRDVTTSHDFSLADIIQRGGYVLSAETEPSRRAPLTVFWRMLFRKMLRTQAPMDLTLLMDEGLAAGKIPNFADALNTLRSKGVSIVFAIQYTAGLKDIYGPQGGPAVEEAFTNRITLLNGLNAEDAEKLSKRLGCYTRVRKQQQGTPTHDRAELIPLEEVLRRGAGEQDRWAVFEIVGATESKRPVIARLVPSDLVIRKPEPSEISPRPEPISEPLHPIWKEDAEFTQCPSPCLTADSSTEEFGGF